MSSVEVTYYYSESGKRARINETLFVLWMLLIYYYEQFHHYIAFSNIHIVTVKYVSAWYEPPKLIYDLPRWMI